MSRVTLNEPVELDGEVTTIARLAAEGRIVFREFITYTRKRLGERHERIVYAAEVKGSADLWWEIGKLAYLSRTKQPSRGLDGEAEGG